jgi:23S rRNA (adenine2503-C2)-methyltransferase
MRAWRHSAFEARYRAVSMWEILREQRGVQNVRFELGLSDGSRIEAVLYRGDTLCISSQIGCAVACPFCASGARGLARSLTLEELVQQVETVRARHREIVGVTASGIGEPLHNAAMPAFASWCSQEKLRFSLTTSGGPIPRLREWLSGEHRGLTISVHAGTEPVRAQMVPRGPTLDALFEALRAEVPRLTRTRRKKTALAYLMVRDRNDTDSELDAFAERAIPLELPVHLYAYNPVPTSADQPVPVERYRAAYERLRAAGLVVRMSSQARIEANGGCGTLVASATKLAKPSSIDTDRRAVP